MRRVISVICALICLFSAAHGEIYAVNFSGGCAAVDDSGATLIPACEYDRLYVLRNDAEEAVGYAAGSGRGSGLMYAVLDASGEPLTDHVYSKIESAGEGCIVYDENGCRYLSAAHKYDDQVFSSMTYVGGGMLLAVNGNIYDDIGDTVSILWSDGISFLTGINMLGSFSRISEGLMPLYDDGTGLYGYINAQGSWVIKPAFRYAADFRNGLAVVATDNGYGVIDSAGNIKLTPNNLKLARSGDIFATIRGDALRVFDSELMITSVIPLSGATANLTGNSIVISQPDQEAVYDVYGSLLFSAPPGSQITDIGSGTYIVRSGPWGEKCVELTWLDGSPLSDPHESVYALDGSMTAYAAKDADGVMRYGLMSYDGACITDAVYLSMACVADGMYCADTENGAVLLDSAGNLLNTFVISDDGLQN